MTQKWLEIRHNLIVVIAFLSNIRGLSPRWRQRKNHVSEFKYLRNNYLNLAVVLFDIVLCKISTNVIEMLAEYKGLSGKHNGNIVKLKIWK